MRQAIFFTAILALAIGALATADCGQNACRDIPASQMDEQFAGWRTDTADCNQDGEGDVRDFVCMVNGLEDVEEILLVNGEVYTVDSQNPWVQALLIRDGVIVHVGTNESARAQAGPGATEIDLEGRMAMPGIHDVHMHPLEARSPFSGTCILDTAVTDPEQYIPVLRQCAPDQQATDWVLGWGHSVFTLLEAQRRPVDILDEAIPDRPAAIMEETSHSFWVNSLALERAGIDADTPNPPGGVIVKDPATGEPTGILFDSAGDLVMDLAWQPTEEIKELNYEGLLEALGELNRHGITSVCEGRTYWKRDFQDAWQRAERESRLTVRAILGLWAYPSMNDEAQLAELRGLYRNDPDALLRQNQVKVYADGILINSTAAMLEPYKETLGDIPSQTGLNYFTEARLARYIEELDPLGFDFHIHAIGDRGVREALNAIEAGQDAGRHRLTHLEVVNPEDYDRFRTLNVIADMQVSGDFAQPQNWIEVAFLIGNRSQNLIPLKDLHEAGARISLSSDWDVSSLNPFVGMQRALTRAPQNLPDLATAVRAYTLDAAYVMRQEDRVGSLEVGKRADLIVLDRNIFQVGTTAIGSTSVLLTMLDGRIVYDGRPKR
ncbi:Amidohydrolase [Sulfidibacter corallicola]|uniref:Amidohydrolase n=1 Tax=Sulfidibacter corallicola TaxID=2818388 RepID=A0A8A4TKG6_SULCO|nr:amidohydrolase [Sulfidibacter corallicola]QTD49371.1 amidohydrolase [Sulfidibacter corallicola]